MFNRGLGKKEKASIILLQEKTRTVRSFSAGSGEKDEQGKLQKADVFHSREGTSGPYQSPTGNRWPPGIGDDPSLF